MTLAIIGVVILILLILFRVPVVIALSSVGFVGIWILKGFNVANTMAVLAPMGGIVNGEIATLPLFILMGCFALVGGVASDAFVALRRLMGGLPGGLGVATIAASTGFAACSGSSVASAVTMGKLAISEMEDNGYDGGLAAGICGAGGLLASSIPPSGLLVLYGLFSGESISELFIAGIVPGLLSAACMVFGIVMIAKLKPELAPHIMERFTVKEKLQVLPKLIGIVIIFGTLFLGLFTGLFTTTESAAFGALAALIILISKGKGFVKKFLSACKETANTSVMIFFLILSAYIFSRFLVLAGLPLAVQNFLLGLDVPPMVIILAMVLVYFILGMFLDSSTIVLLTIPIFLPIVEALGFNGVWFGLVTACMVEVGLLTPPFGLVCFSINSIAPNVGLVKVFKGSLLFVGMQMLTVVLILIFPNLVLWLPSLMG